MSRAPAYFESRRQYGWNTTSPDYHSHLSSIERAPSVLTDVPHYPNVHKVFNNKMTYEEELPRETHKEHSPQDYKKKVPMIETVEEDTNPKGQVHEEIVDSEADGYIQQKHKGFELCKWKTFKM